MIAALILAASHVSADSRAISLSASAMEVLRPTTATSCLSYEVESRTSTTIDIAVREVHNPTCGGDPDMMIVTERFRVSRNASSISSYDAVEDRWMPCKMKGQKRPLCP